MSESEWQFFKSAQNHVVGINENKENDKIVMIIDMAFCADPKNKEYCQNEKQFEYFGKWNNVPDIEDIEDVDKLLWCGFYL